MVRRRGIWSEISKPRQNLDWLNTKIVYTKSVKNITLSADEALIEQARAVAKSERTTLNAAFREWLEQYAARAGRGAAFRALMRPAGRPSERIGALWRYYQTLTAG